MTDPLTDNNPFEDFSYGDIAAELSRTWYDYKYSNADRAYDFHSAMGKTINQWPPTEEEVIFRFNLIQEEWSELQDEFMKTDSVPTDKGDLAIEIPPVKQKVAKELADLLYVVYGTAVSFGIDINKVYAEVHNSNMSKLVDGKPLKRADGKVLKGPNYSPPDLSFVV